MKIDKSFYTSHIKDFEKLITINRLIDKIEIVSNNYSIQYTNFFDPYEIYLAKSILNSFEDLSYRIVGGYKESERNILIIYPNYFDNEEISKGICGVKISNINEEINHRDLLGSILNLGINRDKIGDILVHENLAYLILKEEIKDFLILNLERIKNKKVDVSDISLDEIQAPRTQFRDISISVSSLRLDSIISGGYNLSRGKSIELIESQEVKVNWEKVKKPSKEIKLGDVVSVRKYGRLTLQEISGYSKRGKLRCVVRILI